jgi:predicted nucleic acid-binding protein
MNWFVDTSALYAVLDADNTDHARAKQTWAVLLRADERLCCTNYVLLETISLIQRRLGMEAVRDFQTNVAPLLEVTWLDAAAHRAGVSALLIADRRKLSLVDCTSFETMSRLGLQRVFAIDSHFTEQGFTVVP